MRFEIHSHRHGETILNEPKYKPTYDEVLAVISGITDDELKAKHASYQGAHMSLSWAINDILKEKLSTIGWAPESAIFQGDEFTDNRWRLDFAKGPVSIEVAFNHGEAIAWNLLKPVMASELNHVQKAIQTEIGILITAKGSLKLTGAFDSAVGEFEKFKRYLLPLNNVLTVPMVIIGLDSPETFRLDKVKSGGRNTSRIVEY